MNKSKGAEKEVESPVLTWDSDFGTYAENGIDWVCGIKLKDLFSLGGAHKICFVAKSIADKTTYQIRLGNGIYDLLKPIRTGLYRNFRYWLVQQVNAGRPHIGVRIIK